MDDGEADDMNRDSLLLLLNLDEVAATSWSSGDLGQILSHQLAAPLVLEVTDKTCGDAGAAPIRSLGELLRHPRPPLELLKLTKELAKSSDSRQTSPIPPEVATVLYYASIATAVDRHGTLITSLSPPEVADGFRWCMNQPWVDGHLVRVFEHAVESLATRSTP
ncbi:MAG: hypothetical protein ACAI43_00655 [Phycisphaerae bacterium]|nr:hypothetical protein [Tepidisphaeraceae bacterium]